MTQKQYNKKVELFTSSLKAYPVDNSSVPNDEVKQKVQKAIDNISLNKGLSINDAFDKVLNNYT